MTQDTRESRDSVIRNTIDHVRELFRGEGSGHDWWHIDRVRKVALHLADEEKADRYVVELGALLHDIADWKFHDGDIEAGPRRARKWLVDQGVDETTIDHVCEIIRTVSFKGAGVDTPMATIEGRVVQDADRLDAIGAIGIARTFAYGGHKGREMHDPENDATPHSTFDAYQKSTGPTIHHFYEKLLLLRDRMQTDSGRRMAEGRHAFMERYLEQFYREWEGAS